MATETCQNAPIRQLLDSYRSITAQPHESLHTLTAVRPMSRTRSTAMIRPCVSTGKPTACRMISIITKPAWGIPAAPMLASKAVIATVICCTSPSSIPLYCGSTLLEELMAHAIPVEEVKDSILADLADTESPQGIVAVVEPPRFDVATILPRKGFPVMVLDSVQDPGNVGSILRTAFALGSPGAFLLKGTADVANPKVMRAGMGATLRLPTAKLEVGALARWAEENDVTMWAAGSGGTPVRRLKPPERLAIVVGSEGAGICPAVSAVSHRDVTIPLARGAESLNVAVATGILLSEVQRAT